MASSKCTYSITERIVLALVLAGVGYVYVGFYFPDPHARIMVHRLWRVGILLGARVGIPVLVILGLVIYHRVKTGRTSGANVALAAAGCCVAALLAYPLANAMYYRTSTITTSGEIHPYLQLSPPPIAPHSPGSAERFCIVCLGGSTTQFADSQGRGWPSRLENHLRKRLGRPGINVHNMGMPWYTTLHSVINYASNVRPHKPDLVIVMHAINDVLHNADFCYFSTGPFRNDYGHFFGPTVRLLTRRGFERSFLEKIGWLWYHRRRQVIDQHAFPGLGPFERNLNTIIDLVEKDGARVVLMTQPFLFKEGMTQQERAALYMLNAEAVGHGKRWGLPTALRAMRQYNDVTRRVAKKRGAVLLDLAKRVPKTLDYLCDDVHYTDKGFERVAEVVATALADSGLIPRPTSQPTAAATAPR